MRRRGVPGFLGVWNAEFVSLRIGEHNPWLLPLPHIYPSGPHPQATINFSCLVIRVKSRAGGSRRPWLRAWMNVRPADRSTAGRIEYSSSGCPTTTHPRALAHQRPRSGGCAVWTMSCYQSRRRPAYKPVPPERVKHPAFETIRRARNRPKTRFAAEKTTTTQESRPKPDARSPKTRNRS